jgi:membrane-associated phospholipid phosphatase
VLLLTLPLITTSVYLLTQRVMLFPRRSIPLTPIDHAIAFEPGWVWGYLSLYVLMPIAPLLTRSRQELWRYTRGMLVCFAIGCASFVLFPVAGPRPANAPASWMYGQLITIDRAYNAFPSLHAACAVFAVVYGHFVSRDASRWRLRTVLLCIAWMWVAIILYSTIATRQHYFLDLVPGLGLGAACAIGTMRRPIA